MCIWQIKLEPTYDSFLQTLRESKYKFLVDRLNSVVYKAFK